MNILMGRRMFIVGSMSQVQYSLWIGIGKCFASPTLRVTLAHSTRLCRVHWTFICIMGLIEIILTIRYVQSCLAEEKAGGGHE